MGTGDGDGVFNEMPPRVVYKGFDEDYDHGSSESYSTLHRHEERNPLNKFPAGRHFTAMLLLWLLSVFRISNFFEKCSSIYVPATNNHLEQPISSRKTTRHNAVSN